MNLESQVCSLELSKKLLTLGVNSTSFFAYFVDPSHYGMKWEVNKQIGNVGVPAYTAAELGEMLPNNIIIPGAEPFESYRLSITRFNSVDEEMNIIRNYIVNYECDSTHCFGEEAWLRRKLTSNIYDPNLANAMGKMLIYLIENKLIEIKK